MPVPSTGAVKKLDVIRRHVAQGVGQRQQVAVAEAVVDADRARHGQHRGVEPAGVGERVRAEELAEHGPEVLLLPAHPVEIAAGEAVPLADVPACLLAAEVVDA
jgi:hypothetical protein